MTRSRSGTDRQAQADRSAADARDFRGHDDFTGGPHHRFQEMAAMGRTVPPADDGMGMHRGLALVERNVADQGQKLHLLRKHHRRLV